MKGDRILVVGMLAVVAAAVAWRALTNPDIYLDGVDQAFAEPPPSRERCVLTPDGRHDGCSGAEARVILSQCGARITEACKPQARAALDALAMREDPPAEHTQGFLPPGKFCVAVTDTGDRRDCTLEETRAALGIAKGETP